jgi:hypothetical protein
MNTRLVALACVAALAAGGVSASAKADTLSMDKGKNKFSSLDAPSRGLSMAQVEKRYGAPVSKLAPAGGDAPKHPTINRWQYDHYIVYFERDRVITAVANGGGTRYAPEASKQ